ncbi:related to RNA-binding protein homologous to eukaryotic snRNP [Cephalotrichum gorgonifer]|uniref:Ribosome quality control complex subunit 2 n=1 Tax=Cephalotrichum gorgonifer TaxID=2041049 RepID=A0AAE8STM0_9PEZI|nr:related to RNA-binding protein homologous to eukaryotic snRNP [Cephalotrichum gorgonifer]
MKQGFSSLDVKAVAHELSQTLPTLRLSNIYELSTRILLFKFAKPDVKKQLVVDAGFRCHLTEFARTTADDPSTFIRHLRKALKTRRVTAVRQVGTDRVIELQFSEGQYRLFLEFFAAGNVILTDNNLKILALLRVVHEEQGQVPQKIGSAYAIDQRQNYEGVPPLTKERVREALKLAIERSATGWKKQKPGTALRKGLATTITEVPPVLADHVLQAHGFDVTISLEDILASEEKIDSLFEALQEGRALVDQTASSERCTGYILAKPRAGATPSGDPNDGSSYKREDLLYEDYHPFLPYKYKNDPSYVALTFDNYNKTVDEFHSSIEGQKLESKVQEREETAKRKLNAAREDQAKRIEGLQEAQLLSLRKAAAIETNVERVQEAMDAVNGVLDSGMDWVDVGKLIEREQKRGNPVAAIIKLPMKLAENTITLLLSEEGADEDEDMDEGYTTESSASDSDDEDSESKKPTGTEKLTIDINLGITPWANAREYHDHRRTAAEKEKKTALQTEKAMKSAEQKVKQVLKQGLKTEKPLMQPLRQNVWFDKFLWFISSDGYLVLAGKDTVQSEMLYKRHLRKGDIYCHADVPGAANVVIKNNPAAVDSPIPPSTLAQAGMLSVCTSGAWDSKAVLAAWWVKAEQVTKTLPGGQILPPGSFTVKGEKNFLPPAQLLVGFGVLFRVSEESRARHTKHRIYDAAPEEAGDKSTAGSDGNVSDDADDAAGTKEKGEEAQGDSEAESDDEAQDQRVRGNPLQSARSQNDDEAEEDDGTKAVADLTLSEPTPEATEEVDKSTTANESVQGSADAASRLEVSTPTSRPASTAPSEKKQGPKRGQRSKAKKIAMKYKDQDEEDRTAVEDLIGATAGRQRAEEAAREKARREAEAEAQRERRRAQIERQRAQAAEHELRRAKMMEEGRGDEPLEPERLDAVEALVGTPLPDDEILEAVPFCAPWAALAKVKYKVKLQPGSLKRGKAVKDILERWKIESERKGALDPKGEDREKMWPREVELLKGLRAEEAVGVVPVGKVTIMMSRAGSGGGGKGPQGKGKGKAGGNKKK